MLSMEPDGTNGTSTSPDNLKNALEAPEILEAATITLFNLAATQGTNPPTKSAPPNHPTGTPVKQNNLTECSLYTEQYKRESCLMFVFYSPCPGHSRGSPACVDRQGDSFQAGSPTAGTPKRMPCYRHSLDRSQEAPAPTQGTAAGATRPGSCACVYFPYNDAGTL